MAGNGRMKPVLKRFFKNIDMLEQSPEMTAEYLNDIEKYNIRIQDFEWMCNKYWCIYGCWCFGYLNDKEREDAIVGMNSALIDDGFLIFFEAVTKTDEKVEKRMHWWTAQ